jgi:hypothetical protein
LVPPRLADFAELDSSRWLIIEKGTKKAIRDRSPSLEAQRANLPIATAPKGISRAQKHAPEKTEISATINTENTKLDRAIPQAKINDVPSQPNELPWTWRRPHFAGYNPTRATEDANRKRTVSAYSKPAGGGPVVSPKNTPSPRLATAHTPVQSPSRSSTPANSNPESERSGPDSEKYTDVKRVENFNTTEDTDVNDPEGDPTDPNIVDWDLDDPEKAMNWP